VKLVISADSLALLCDPMQCAWRSMAAWSKACAAASSPSWQPRCTCLPPTRIYACQEKGTQRRARIRPEFTMMVYSAAGPALYMQSNFHAFLGEKVAERQRQRKGDAGPWPMLAG